MARQDPSMHFKRNLGHWITLVGHQNDIPIGKPRISPLLQRYFFTVHGRNAGEAQLPILAPTTITQITLLISWYGQRLVYVSMSLTPRSGTPSRAGTPLPTRSPSRLVVPTLRPTHSLSNLHVHSRGAPAAPLPTTSTSVTAQITLATPQPSASVSNQELDSSASSIVDAEGILVQEVDAGVDTNDGEDAVAVGYVATDEGSKKNLRDQLRRTLTKRLSNLGG